VNATTPASGAYPLMLGGDVVMVAHLLELGRAT
jgi:hypothetical protein